MGRADMDGKSQIQVNRKGRKVKTKMFDMWTPFPCIIVNQSDNWCTFTDYVCGLHLHTAGNVALDQLEPELIL